MRRKIGLSVKKAVPSINSDYSLIRVALREAMFFSRTYIMIMHRPDYISNASNFKFLCNVDDYDNNNPNILLKQQ